MVSAITTLMVVMSSLYAVCLHRGYGALDTLSLHTNSCVYYEPLVQISYTVKKLSLSHCWWVLQQPYRQASWLADTKRVKFYSTRYKQKF